MITLNELDKCAATDDEVQAVAQSLDASLVTNDLDFGNILPYPPSSHAGIVLLRIDHRMIS